MVRLGVDRLGRSRRRDRGIILAYHNIVPDAEPATGDRSLHLRVNDFARQLDLLSAVGQVVPLDALLRGSSADGERPAFAITFDDAYRGAVTLGVEELARRGLPATIFVAPGILGDRTLWWDGLAATAGPAGFGALRQTILGEGPATLEAAAWAGGEAGVAMQTMPAALRSAEIEEVHHALRVPGITIGSHSWSHASLVRLPAESLADELARSRDWLKHQFGARYVDFLSYPYGLHSAAARDAVRVAGYEGGLALHPGSVAAARSAAATRRSAASTRSKRARARESDPDMSSDADRFQLPRLNIPAGLSASGFRLRSAWV